MVVLTETNLEAVARGYCSGLDVDSHAAKQIFVIAHGTILVAMLGCLSSVMEVDLLVALERLPGKWLAALATVTSALGSQWSYVGWKLPDGPVVLHTAAEGDLC